ncbi:hypothetical protein C8R42DRAFT_185118 [Lentinula raphanica]|nr:hypothetical protein C8R42DRAFT_185118 [Lentinula raphanica]KAJ3822390.1 hypothetical protein F5880DRAFT_682529 [Lentinula raphanica]
MRMMNVTFIRAIHLQLSWLFCVISTICSAQLRCYIAGKYLCKVYIEHHIKQDRSLRFPAYPFPNPLTFATDAEPLKAMFCNGLIITSPLKCMLVSS